jgi:flagellar hook-basal body complex protein FliE
MSIGPVEPTAGFAAWMPSVLNAGSATNGTPGVPGENATGALTGLSGITGTSGVGSSTPTADADFGTLLAQGLDKVDSLQRNADELAVQAATGELENLHDYTIAATEATVATQLTANVRNKALEAFTEIMRMPI